MTAVGRRIHYRAARLGTYIEHGNLCYFYSSSSGGRNGPTPSHVFRCLMQIDTNYYSVWIDLEEVGIISPGQTVLVPVVLLYPELARQHYTVGKKVFLRELRTIAEGEITELLFRDTPG